ncbi:MAG: helix-turn-helix transcriptional regulator [Armatimonadota bacterium]
MHSDRSEYQLELEADALLEEYLYSRKKNRDGELYTERQLDMKHEVAFSQLSDECLYHIELTNSMCDTYELVDICEAAKLTEAQAEVAELLMDGYTHEEIAQRLGISKSSVRDRVEAIRKKLIRYYEDK